MGCFKALLILLALNAPLGAVPPPTPTPAQLQQQVLRLRAEIHDLRWRLQRESEREGPREGLWWDLPSRRRQQQRLRRLRHLRQRLEDAQIRLWALESKLQEPEKPLKDKP